MIYLLTMKSISCFFACLVISDWTLDIADMYASLNAEYFCVPINILKFCPEMHLSFLETVSSFQVLLVVSDRQDLSGAQLPTAEALQCPLDLQVMKFSSLPCRTNPVYQALLPSFVSGHLSLALGSFPTSPR